MIYQIKYLLSFVLMATFLLVGCGEQANSNNNNSLAEQTKTVTYTSVGVIKKINTETGEMTIDHEDIKGYMSAMEMTEPVSDPTILPAFKPGDKVNFEVERTGSELIITKLEKIGEVSLIIPADIYRINCAECHGDKGQGDKKGIPFTSGHALHHSEADFIKTVTNGKDKGKQNTMPSFKEKLTAEEIVAVVKFVRQDIQNGRSVEPKSDHKHSH